MLSADRDALNYQLRGLVVVQGAKSVGASL
jgi:hypothetical protein